MSKQKPGKKQGKQSGASPAQASTSIESAELPGGSIPLWYFVAATLALAAAYYIYSFFSKGFYQHDEIAHFLNMKEFWVDPRAIIASSWAKPGYKLVYVVPALTGAQGVAIFNCLITAAAAWVTALVGRKYGLKYVMLAFVFVGFQAILFQCSFRNYSELLSALTIAGLMYFYAKENWILAAISSSYLFLLRSELALISIALGVIFLMRRRYIPFLLLGWAPVALHLGGWMATGASDFLFSFTFASSGEYNERGFFHFWRMFTPAIGAVVTFFFLRGFFGFLGDPEGSSAGLKKYWERYHLAYLIFLIYFLSICLFTDEAFQFLKLTANFRQLIVVAPTIGFFAMIGFNNLFETNNSSRYLTMGLGVAYAAIVMSTASLEHDYMKYLETTNYNPLIALVVVLGAIMGMYYMNLSGTVVAVVVAVAGIGLTLADEKPKLLSERDLVFEQAADWFKKQPQSQSAPYIVNNHIVFHHFYGTSGSDRVNKFRKINRSLEMQVAIDSLDGLPAGTILFWDTHYTYQQRSKGERMGIPQEHVFQNPNYRALQQFITRDRSYGTIVFEKLSAGK